MGKTLDTRMNAEFINKDKRQKNDVMRVDLDIFLTFTIYLDMVYYFRRILRAFSKYLRRTFFEKIVNE